MHTETKKLTSTGRYLFLGIVFLVVLMLVGANLAFMHVESGKAAQAVSGNGSSFSFTAAGDYDQTAATTANLHYITQSGASFHLGLGDFDYDPAVTADQWSSYAKGLRLRLFLAITIWANLRPTPRPCLTI